MRNCVGINIKKDEIIIRISEAATHEEVMECLNKKIPAKACARTGNGL